MTENITVTIGNSNEAQQTAWAWQELPQPVIASVQGCAMGVGVDIAKLSDLKEGHQSSAYKLPMGVYSISSFTMHRITVSIREGDRDADGRVIVGQSSVVDYDRAGVGAIAHSVANWADADHQR
jgi:hypothetical protein